MKKFQLIKFKTHDIPMQLVRDNHLAKDEYTIQFIDSTQGGETELFGIALVGTGRYIMQTESNAADLWILYELAKSKTFKNEVVVLPVEPRFYGRTSTFNRFA